MSGDVLEYFGWSALALQTRAGALFFDPFFRRYCGVQWFGEETFRAADYICVTHGHEEHFLDVPVLARAGHATIIGSPSLIRFLHRRNRIPANRLVGCDPQRFGTTRLKGFEITTFTWKHRDINLYKALGKAVFQGNATQLSWAWSSATRAPFYSPYTGFHVRLDSGLSVLNYNEGFNPKMTEAEITALGRRLQTDVLLAGMQLDFVDDVVRGVAALKPSVVVLYPPHEHFHAMMGVRSTPWETFARAVRTHFPHVDVHLAQPGFRLPLAGPSMHAQARASA